AATRDAGAAKAAADQAAVDAAAAQASAQRAAGHAADADKAATHAEQMAKEAEGHAKNAEQMAQQAQEVIDFYEVAAHDEQVESRARQKAQEYKDLLQKLRDTAANTPGAEEFRKALDALLGTLQDSAEAFLRYIVEHEAEIEALVQHALQIAAGTATAAGGLQVASGAAAACGTAIVVSSAGGVTVVGGVIACGVVLAGSALTAGGLSMAMDGVDKAREDLTKLQSNINSSKSGEFSGFTEVGSGDVLRRSATYKDTTYRFNSDHSYNRRHASGDLRDTGLTMDQIEMEIMKDLHKFRTEGGTIPRGGEKASALDRTTVISGHAVGYHTVQLPNGSIMISTYFPRIG
ncbi:hypothetical protein, partial [Streptoalloteichus tenebrarius]